MPPTNRQVKDTVYEELARIGKAVAAPKRIELLDLLCQGPKTVEALANQTSMSVANASRHLQVLRGAGLLACRRRGLHVEYRLASDDVSGFFVDLLDVAESRLADLDKLRRTYFDHRPIMVERVDGEELLRRVRSGEVTVVDVRPLEEYRAGHIPGALSVPLTELEDRIADLPRGREIVAYCRGRYCTMAIEAARSLSKRGFRARAMEYSIVDWRLRGGHVESLNEASS